MIWSVLSQFKWLLLFLHHGWRGHGARLSIRTKDPNNHSDTETGTLSNFGLNFDATDLPFGWFKPLYPKVSTGTLKVDLVPLIWHIAPPKVRKPRFVSA